MSITDINLQGKRSHDDDQQSTMGRSFSRAPAAACKLLEIEHCVFCSIYSMPANVLVELVLWKFSICHDVPEKYHLLWFSVCSLSSGEATLGGTENYCSYCNCNCN